MWTNAEKTAIDDWIKAKVPACSVGGIGSFCCQHCGNTCVLPDYVCGQPGQGTLGLTVGPTRAVGFALICPNCSYQYFFDNAVAQIF